MNKIKDFFITEWNKFYKLYSVWFFAIIAILPEIHALALEYSIMNGDAIDGNLNNAIKTLAFLGAASRLIKQKVEERKADK